MNVDLYLLCGTNILETQSYVLDPLGPGPLRLGLLGPRGTNEGPADRGPGPAHKGPGGSMSPRGPIRAWPMRAQGSP